MDVLDPEQDRPLFAEAREQLEERLEQPDLRFTALAVGGGCVGRPADLGTEPGELRPALVAELVQDRLAGPVERAQRRDEGRVGHLALGELDAGAADHADVVGLGRGDQLREQPALADAGLAGEEQDEWQRGVVRERLPELGELLFPADEAAAADPLHCATEYAPDRPVRG